MSHDLKLRSIISQLREKNAHLIDPDLAVHIVEEDPIAIIVACPEGRIAFLNKASEIMFGYPRQELYDRPVSMLVPPELRGAHERGMEDYLENPYVRPVSQGDKFQAIDKSGITFPVDIQLAPLVTSYGTFVAAYVRKRGDNNGGSS